MPRGQFEEPQDDELDDQETAENPEVDADLEEEPDEEPEAPAARRRADPPQTVNAVKAQMGAALKTLQDAARRHGLDFQDGELVVRNRAVAAGLIGLDQTSQREQPKRDEPETPVEVEMPDAALDPEGFKAWMKAERVRMATEIRKEIAGSVEPALDAARDRAMLVAERTLPKYGWEHLLDHPEFEERLGAALATAQVPVSQWKDPKVIQRICGLLYGDLMDSMPESSGDRKQRGRRAAADDDEPEEDLGQRPAARSALARSNAQQIGASRGGSRSSQAPTFTKGELDNARRMGVTPAQYRLLGDDETGERYLTSVRKQQQRDRDAKAARTRGEV